MPSPTHNRRSFLKLAPAGILGTAGSTAGCLGFSDDRYEFGFMFATSHFDDAVFQVEITAEGDAFIEEQIFLDQGDVDLITPPDHEEKSSFEIKFIGTIPDYSSGFLYRTIPDDLPSDLQVDGQCIGFGLSFVTYPEDDPYPMPVSTRLNTCESFEEYLQSQGLV